MVDIVLLSLPQFPKCTAHKPSGLCSLACVCSNQDAWTAFVRTQDLAPPVLTIVDKPAPDFDSFSVIAQLDEPGTVYAALLLSSNTNQVTAIAKCPLVIQVGKHILLCYRLHCSVTGVPTQFVPVQSCLGAGLGARCKQA